MPELAWAAESCWQGQDSLVDVSVARCAVAEGGSTSMRLPSRDWQQSTRLKLERLQAVSTCLSMSSTTRPSTFSTLKVSCKPSRV